MGMKVFRQKEPKNSRRPQNLERPIPAENCRRKHYGHEAFADLGNSNGVFGGGFSQ